VNVAAEKYRHVVNVRMIGSELPVRTMPSSE